MANYRLAELDFDEIKVNLKQFLTNYRDKDNNLIFKDYDFEASSLNILIDLPLLMFIIIVQFMILSSFL